MARIINYAADVDDYLKNLMHTLFEQDYFSYRDSAKKYVENIVIFANTYVGVLAGRDAPPYFNRYGSQLKYIVFHANRTTSWYILYQQNDSRFLICHITNNHAAGQYFNG